MSPWTRLRVATGVATTVLQWAVVAALVAVVGAAVVVPRLAGATPYTVLTGSMRPAMPPGTLVVVRPVRAEQIAVGDVVTYQLVSGEPTVVTHRVVELGVDGEGRRVFRTQGDANGSADQRWVRPVQLRGERWYAVPYVGRVGLLLDEHQRELAVTVVALGLIGYAAAMILGAWRERTRPREVGLP